MTSYDDLCSDEATGLPPLEPEPDGGDTMWAMVLGYGEGLVRSPVDGHNSAVFVLSVRGVVNGPDGPDDRPEWAQFHVAFPEDTIDGLERAIQDYRAKHQ